MPFGGLRQVSLYLNPLLTLYFTSIRHLELKWKQTSGHLYLFVYIITFMRNFKLSKDNQLTTNV